MRRLNRKSYSYFVKRNFPRSFVLLFFFLWNLLSLHAQLSERVYERAHAIDSTKERNLYVEIDNVSFFKDNEFAGSVMKGYTLPGLWLEGKGVYYPLRNIKLELGFHALMYRGSYKYPNMAYRDIATWKGNQYQVGVHILPYIRGQVALSSHVNIILGNLYGGANHHLIEPLYNPELNMTADPEAGLQLLYNSSRFDLDAWVNWESFIFKGDSHKEAFTVGLSTRFKFNDPASRFHFYVPVQALAQHRGGEIDTIMTNSVQTLMNGALGVGSDWNIGHPVFKKVHLEFDFAGYYQQAGKIWPFGSGYGYYALASADVYNFRVKASYWKCDKFVSMFGSPFYGAMSTKHEGATFDKPGTIYVGLEYSRSFGKYYALGIDVDLYNSLPVPMKMADGVVKDVNSSMSFSAGVYLRINPSFFLTKIGQK